MVNPFHLFAFNEVTGGAVTNTQIDAVADDVYQPRNNNLFLTRPQNLIWAYPTGATQTRKRFGNISLQYRGIQHLYPVQQSATTVDRPEILDYRKRPIRLPAQEEIIIEGTNGAADAHGCLLGIAPLDWTDALPEGEEVGWVRGTVVLAAGTETTWNALVRMTLERDLFKGVYSCIGARIIAANSLAFRMMFPAQQSVNGKQHRPGGPSDNAAGQAGSALFSGLLGEWGRFRNDDLPSIQTLADAAGGTYEVRLLLKYLGEDDTFLF